MTKDLDAVVLGGVGIDTNVFLPGTDIDFSVESNFTDNKDCVGQAGGYSARLFAALEKKTALLAAVGNDFLGHEIRRVLQGDGIETHFFLDPAGTNRSVNLMGADGRRRNFYDAKSAMDLRADPELARQLFQRARIAHFSIQNWCRFLLPLAKDAGCLISVDLQDVIDPKDTYRHDFALAADVIFFSSANLSQPSEAAQFYLQNNPKRIVVIGKGSQGCELVTATESLSLPAMTHPLAVVDTNGAGDSLAVGFLVAHFLEGYSLKDSLVRAQMVARHTCTLRGTSDGLLTKQELDERFNRLP